MDNLTRRRFLGWTTAGAAGIGLVSLARQLTSRDGATTPSTTPAAVPALAAAGALSEPLVAYVQNAASGEISVMAGTQEVILHDPDLVSRLINRAAGR